MSSEDYKRLFALTGNCSIHNLLEWKAVAILVTFYIFAQKRQLKRGMRDRDRARQ